MPPLNESAAIPSATIPIASSSDEPEPAMPEVVVVVVPAGVGVASIRGTST